MKCQDCKAKDKEIKRLVAWNKYLWYHNVPIDEDAVLVEINQYDKKGENIACSTSVYPHKRYRTKPPKPIKE